MAIVSSSIIEDAAQIDGRRHIRERHIDHLGVAHFRLYMANAGVNVAPWLAATAAALPGWLSDTEIALNFSRISQDGDLAVPTLVYSTANDNAAFVRREYKSATREQAMMIGAYLSTLTNAQLRNLFNLTDPQVAQLRTKVDAQKALLDEQRAATGA